MKFYGIINQGKLTLMPLLKRQRQNYLSSLKDDTRVIEEIKRDTKSKTHQQIKTIWGLALATVKAEFDDRGWDTSVLYNLDKPTGIGVTANMLKEFFYGVIPMYNGDGQRITLSHKDCSTIIAAKFFEDMRNFSASQFSIYIPDPNPNWQEEQSDGG